MPRKNRSTAVALVFALLLCLAGQAAAAMPVAGPRAAAGDTTAGHFLATVWAWLASRWTELGNVVASPARHATAPGHVMGAGAGDPNGGH